MTKKKSKKKYSLISIDADTIEVISKFAKAIGTPGAAFIILLIILTIWTSSEQKHKIVDYYILFESSGGVNKGIITIVVLLAILTAQIFFCRVMLKLRKEENNRIGKRKSELQQSLFNVQLNTSEK